jgi:hypothetical protein
MLNVSWKFLRTALALLMAFALTACSGLQIGYRHADIFLTWKVNEYFDLDKEQEAMVKPAIAAALAWHRQSELPAYGRLLETVQTKLNGKITADDASWFDGQVRGLTRNSIEHLAVDGAPILAIITPAQVTEMERRLAKDNETFFDKYARGPMDKQQARRTKRFIEGAEHWVGSLSDEQKAKIQTIVAEAPTRYGLQLEERRRVQHEFATLLREKNTPASIIPKLKAWIANWEAGRSPAYVESARVSNDQLIRMTLVVTDSMTAAQRKNAHEQLQSYIDTMSALVAAKN